MEQQNEGVAVKTSPRDVFLHLLSVIALYVSAGSFVSLVFQYINVWIPDPVAEGRYYHLSSAYSSIRWSVAILLVVFPVYLWSNWFLQKMYRAMPEKRELKTRKWLLYFTLFAAALIIMGDVVALIYNFLEGELTLRFFLKILSVLLVAASVLGYYLWELRGRSVSALFVYLVIAIVFLSIVVGFFVAGSPKEERARRFDEQRISDLQVLQSQVVQYWQQKERIPESTGELRDEISGFIPPKDPESGAEYEYRKKDGLLFELCANFSRPSRDEFQGGPKPVRPYYPPGPEFFDGEANWQHAEGRICFERKIDPEIYRPVPKERRP